MEDGDSKSLSILFQEVYMTTSEIYDIDIAYDTDSNGNTYKIVHINSKFTCGFAVCKKCKVQMMSSIPEDLPNILDGHTCEPAINETDATAIAALFSLHNFI